MIQESLLYAILSQNNSEILFRVKEHYLSLVNKKHFLFVKDYFGKYKVLPEVDTVEQKFNISLPVTNDKADYWLAEVIKKYKDKLIETAVIDSAKDKKKAVSIMQKAILDYNSDAEIRVADYGTGAMNRLTRYQSVKNSGGISYLSTGSEDFDVIIKGYKHADLISIGGREGVGKSWLILRMAIWLDKYLKTIAHDNRPILFVTNEMDIEECEDRLDCINTGIAYDDFISGKLSKNQELKYARYLRSIKSHIKFVDDCATSADVDAYISIYNPALVFIDGSHLLSKDFDWKEMYNLTMNLKKMTRLHRVPIINTTHLKSGKGKSDDGGDVDDFAYAKGYTRDSDVVIVMYAGVEMELDNEIGLDFAKVRRGVRTKLVYRNDFKTMDFTLVSSVANMTSFDEEDDEDVFNQLNNAGGGNPTKINSKHKGIFPEKTEEEE